MSRRAGPPRYVLLAVIGSYALLVWRLSFLCDDAFIAFRYAHNFAEGVGLRYNPGVEPPVEGYANFAWLVWLGLLDWLGLDLTFFSRVGEIASGILLVILVVRTASRESSHRWASALTAGLFIGTMPPIAVWSTGGLGTMPFVLALFVAAQGLLVEHPPAHRLRNGLALLLVALLRADGWWWIGLLLLAVALRGRNERTVRARAVGAAAVCALGTTCYLFWRHATYGDWLPNTAYVKVAGSFDAWLRGGAYCIEQFLSFPGLTLAWLAGSLVLWRSGGRRAAAPLLMAWGTVAYAVLVGGDFMCMGRFLVPMVPFVALGFARIVDQLFAAGSVVRWSGLAATLLCLLADLAPAITRPLVPHGVRARFHSNWNLPEYLDPLDQWRFMRHNVERWTDLGRALAAHTNAGESLVSGAIGAVGYYSGLFIYDRQGLVTREVARRPGAARHRSPGHDKEVPARFFLDRRPTYLSADLVPLESRARSVQHLGEISPEGVRYERLVIPLDPAAGFSPRTGLFLVRLEGRR